MKIIEADQYYRKHNIEMCENLYGYILEIDTWINLATAPHLDRKKYEKKFSYYDNLKFIQGKMN